MGSSINIGLVNKECLINSSAKEFISHMDNFVLCHMKYPGDDQYSFWISKDDEGCSISYAIDKCCIYEMAYFMGEFDFYGKKLRDVRFSIEKSANGNACLLIQIPDKELLDNIDEAENEIINLLRDVSGFIYAFCDIEAHIDEKEYSIMVEYSVLPHFVFSKWKIDGLTDRMV